MDAPKTIYIEWDGAVDDLGQSIPRVLVDLESENGGYTTYDEYVFTRRVRVTVETKRRVKVETIFAEPR